ncbi:MAG TPA: hypothetical protein QGF05_07410, partial [Dehalococcoidia bacterium]|nr:hypothetical protein [Dehalococcoidia bacterium]
MCRIHPLIRLTGLAFAVLVLLAACGGGDSDPVAGDGIGEQTASEASGVEDGADAAATPEQREQAVEVEAPEQREQAVEVEALASRRNVSLGVTAPTAEGVAQPLTSIVEGDALDVERIARSVVRVE